MMDATKIRLSEEEVSLAKNAEIILTKNAVMKKMQGLMEELQSLHETELTGRSFLPSEVRRQGPKISRGENYLGLPYLVLDQPRCFEINHILAIRILFWWGRSFILTLHLSGRHKERFEKKILDAYDQLAAAGFYFCIHEDQWKHHLEADNYIPLSDSTKQEIEALNASRPFLKLAKRIELGDINNTPREIHQDYLFLLKVLEGT